MSKDITVLKPTNSYNSIWNKNPSKSSSVLAFSHYILANVMLLLHVYFEVALKSSQDALQVR